MGVPGNDIRPLGAGDGRAFYWIKDAGQYGAPIRLVSIDEHGEVTYTPIRAGWDDAAMTKAEAVEAHLSGGIAEADRELERRRREMPDPKPMPPPPPDPATERFFRTD